MQVKFHFFWSCNMYN